MPSPATPDRSISPPDVVRLDPSGEQARRLSDALWLEIQQRYGFSAPNPYSPSDFAGDGCGFWGAVDAGAPVASVALSRIDADTGEIDIMFVEERYRRRGLARRLLAALEDHAKQSGITTLLLRTGEPQPEAVALYESSGFVPTPTYGKWVADPTARCFRKSVR